jgi:tetratricopeptide (TPR) repeat protein
MMPSVPGLPITFLVLSFNTAGVIAMHSIARSSLRFIAILLLLALLGGCTYFICPAKGGATWRELKSDHFVLQTDVDQSEARHILEQLEQMRAALVQIIIGKAEAETGRLKVIVIAERSRFTEFMPSKEFAGLFRNTQLGDEVIILRSDNSPAQRRTIAHELTHSLSLHLIGRQPLWLAEGLAGYFETIGDADAKNTLTAGQVQPYYWNLIREEPSSTDKLLHWQQARDGDANLYAASWLLVHYLIDTRPREFRNYQNRLAMGEEHRAAWNGAFPQWSLDKQGALEKLDAALDSYRLLADFKTRALTVQTAAPATERILDSAEVHTIRLDWKMDWTPQTLENEFREVQFEDPHHVGAMLALAKKEPQRALELAKLTVAAHPDEPRAWQFLGLAMSDKDLADRQEAAFRKALELDPGRTAYVLNLATALVERNRPDQAAPLFRRAVRQAPWSWVAQCGYARSLDDMNDCAEGANNGVRCGDLLLGGNVPEKSRRQIIDELAERNRLCRMRQGGV